MDELSTGDKKKAPQREPFKHYFLNYSSPLTP